MSCRFYLKITLKIIQENIFNDRLSNENHHSDEINTRLPPKLKFSANNVYDREERLTTSHVKTLYACTYGSIYESSYYAKYICFTFSLYHSSLRDNQEGKVCRWRRIHSLLQKSLNSLCNQWNDHFHCRMSSMQPTWVGCTTSECLHTRCWPFCSCSSHKVIPSHRELVVAPSDNTGPYSDVLSIIFRLATLGFL